MQHFHLLYFFITVLIGIVSLAITANIYIRTKDKFLKSYLYFYSAFTSDIILAALILYIKTNIITPPVYISELVSYIATITHYTLMFTIALFSHELCSVPNAKTRNVFFAGISILLFIGYNFFAITDYGEQHKLIFDYIEASVFMAVVLYAFFNGIFYYKSIQEEIRKKVIFKIIILLGIFIPGIMFDAFPNDIPSIVFPQLLYCGFSVIFTYYLIRHYPSVTVANLQSIISEEEFFDLYNLSPREREIASLLLLGHKNNYIAETLFIALPTVKTHLRNLYSKFGVSSRYEFLVLYKNRKRSSNP